MLSFAATEQLTCIHIMRLHPASQYIVQQHRCYRCACTCSKMHAPALRMHMHSAPITVFYLSQQRDKNLHTATVCMHQHHDKAKTDTHCACICARSNLSSLHFRHACMQDSLFAVLAACMNAGCIMEYACRCMQAAWRMHKGMHAGTICDSFCSLHPMALP